MKDVPKRLLQLYHDLTSMVELSAVAIWNATSNPADRKLGIRYARRLLLLHLRELDAIDTLKELAN